MITTKATSWTTPERRSSGRPTRGNRRTAPAIEGLEDRRLLSISITEYPIPTANTYPSAIALGPDGSIWFTEPHQNQVARINPTTHLIKEFPEPAGTGQVVDSLVAASDGYLYGISSSRNLVRIDPTTGGMTEFSLPSPTGHPGNLAVGPDDNLWFTESSDIGKFNLTTHTTTEYTVTGGLANPYGIAKGPDGALWFTESSGSKIGRIDATTGAIVEYPTPTSGAYPQFIASGTDGNMWFTEMVPGTTGRVGLMNPTTRVIKEVPITVPGVSENGPFGISAGPGGNMWLSEVESGEVTEIDVNSHATTGFAPPASSNGVGQLTQGPGGSLWFIDLNGNAIGEVSDAAVVPPLASTQTAVSSSANPSTVGQPVTFTAVVTAASYHGTPTGTVTFSIDGQAETPVALALKGGIDQAQFTTSTLSAGSHTVSASYSGDNNVSASSGSLVTQAVDAPGLQATTTILASSLNPSTVGQPVTFTAIVSPSGATGIPSGTVKFSIDGKSLAPVSLALVGGRDQATLSIASLGAGTHTISAAYSGSSSFAASAVASSMVQTIKAVPAPAGDGPKVELVQRFGIHMQPTVLVVRFDEALDPASAVNLNNYRITDPAGRLVRIKSAVFDSALDTVTLSPAERINLHHTYHFTMVGTGPGGIRNTQGELLDGADTGSVDGDFTGTLTWRNVVLTPAEAKKLDRTSGAKLGGPLNHRFLQQSP
jgi:virginiamycin B lyase